MHLRTAFLFKSIPNRSHFHDTFVNCLFCLDNLKYSRRKTGKINENVFGNIKVFLKHKLIRILIELTFGDVRISGESLFCKEFDKLIPHFCMAYISDVYFPGPVPDNSIHQSETGGADIWPIRGSYPARISIYWWLSNDGFLLRSCSLSSDSVITLDFKHLCYVI